MWDYYYYYYYCYHYYLRSSELWLFLCQHSSYQSQSYQITRFPQENSPGTQKSRTLFRILAVSNSVGFCSRPVLIPIPSISNRCPKFLVTFPRAPFDKRYSCTSLHSFIHIIFLYPTFFYFLSSNYPTTSRNNAMTSVLLLTHYYKCQVFLPQ